MSTVAQFFTGGRTTSRRDSFAANERGQGLAEYALILTFVAAVVVASLGVLGTNISSFYNTVAGKF